MRGSSHITLTVSQRAAHMSFTFSVVQRHGHPQGQFSGRGVHSSDSRPTDSDVVDSGNPAAGSVGSS